jgi:hypothetical protein
VSRVIHIAGIPAQHQQLCAQCGWLLITYVGAQTLTNLTGERYWPSGAYIERDGPATFMTDNKPTCEAR